MNFFSFFTRLNSLTAILTVASYPIFMAIAEQIGYDATGKKIAVNELDLIGEELKKFIETLSVTKCHNI